VTRRRARRGWVVITVVLVLLATGAAIAVMNGWFASRGNSAATSSGPTTSTATVERRSLSTQEQFTGTLGYSGAYSITSQSHGTVTWLPNVGQVITSGQVLYQVNDVPVVLLYGSVPAYRALAVGSTAAIVTGPDVAELNHDLVALGYVDASDVASAWDQFTWATRAGVEELQHHLGVDETGTLTLGDVVFLPTAARITALQAGLGALASGLVLSATSTTPTVSMALAADLQTQVHAGDPVMIMLPNGATTPGTVRSVGTVASAPADGSGGQGSSGSAPTVPVTIQPTNPSAIGRLDEAPVLISITDRTVHDVLAVDVDALLAQAGGGYAVEVVDGNGAHHLVSVRPGLFDDTAGMVQVSGTALAAGQLVVVPGNA
jgi:hypothetical protein